MSALRVCAFSCVVPLLVLTAAGCGGEQATPSAENAPAEATTPSTEQREADLAAREKEIALQEKEQELARREAALAEQREPPATRPAATPKPAAAPAGTPAGTPAAPQPVIVQIPAGTDIAVELSAPLSTKTSTVGTPIEGRLASDLVVDGRRVAAAGASVLGTVTEVVSAKAKIGGKAKLGLSFESLQLVGGDVVSITATTLEAGKSNTGRDAATIGGATAAGAVLGHQVDDDKGKIIGGIVGGAIGTAVAAKTGTELELAAGTVLTVKIENGVEVRLPG